MEIFLIKRYKTPSQLAHLSGSTTSNDSV